MTSRIQIKRNGNGNGIEERVDFLREVTTALLDEVKSLKPVRRVELDKGVNFYEEIKNFEIYLIETALEKTGGRQKEAARLLKLNCTTLNSKIKRYDIQLGSLNESNGFRESD